MFSVYFLTDIFLQNPYLLLQNIYISLILCSQSQSLLKLLYLYHFHFYITVLLLVILKNTTCCQDRQIQISQQQYCQLIEPSVLQSFTWQLEVNSSTMNTTWNSVFKILHIMKKKAISINSLSKTEIMSSFASYSFLYLFSSDWHLIQLNFCRYQLYFTVCLLSQFYKPKSNQYIQKIENLETLVPDTYTNSQLRNPSV